MISSAHAFPAPAFLKGPVRSGETGSAVDLLEAAAPGARRAPRYAVVLHNDPINGFDFVIRALCRVFAFGAARAFWLTLKAHRRGQAVLWTGSRDEARQRAERIVALGPDPLMRKRGAQPLRVTVDPVSD